jgi:hypothetical protein
VIDKAVAEMIRRKAIVEVVVLADGPSRQKNTEK